MITVIISFAAILLVIAGLVAYSHFLSKQENLENENNLKPKNDESIIITSDSIIINNSDKRELSITNTESQIPLNSTILAGEANNVQNDETINTTTTTVESQITDAVTTKPIKPKRKRGRKPTKKVKK